jgi:uncharacterized protein YjbI with pentapeptide repeats
LTGVVATRRVLRAPEAPRLDDEAEELSPGPDELRDARAVSEARLVDVDLSSARLAGLRLTDVVVERGSLANLVAPELSLRRVVVTGARLTGVAWTRGTIADAAFRDCRVDLATFAGTTLERVTFDGCRLAQTDFREALLRSVRFDACDLTGADLSLVRLDGCEVRGCVLDGLTGLERLRGAAMPWADVVGNAALFAAALGIRVLEDEER